MNVSQKRELVVEFTRTQRVRRRAKLELLVCKDCGRQVDFVSLVGAAKVFDVGTDELVRFISENACHFAIHATGEVHICLVSFLKAMEARTADRSFAEQNELKEVVLYSITANG